MKICIINVAVWVEGFHDVWYARMKESFRKVLRPNTEVVVKPIKRGLGNALDFRNAYFDLLNKREIVEAIIEAWKEGVDAVVVGCGADTGVKEARTIVDIPVIGPGESTMLFACQLGGKFGAIISNMPEGIAPAEERIRLLGLQDRVIPNGVRYDIHPFAETWERGVKDPNFVAEGVVQRAKELVADGADVIVITCCGIGPFCTMAGLSKVKVGDRDIPILDPMMISVKTAEMAVDLKQGIGLPFTSMVRPSKEDVKRVRALFGLPT
jgi:allantoin racemase